MFGKICKFFRNGMFETPTSFDLDIKTLNYVNKSDNENPKYACVGDSGFDLRAWITKEEKDVKIDKDSGRCAITLKPMERRMVHTGLYFNLPEHTEIQVRPRSGLAFKQGLSVINTPGTVDELYTNEVCVLLVNLSKDKITITSGDRIAQAVLMPVYNSKLVNLTEVETIVDNNERGLNGFGHSGVK